MCLKDHRMVKAACGASLRVLFPGKFETMQAELEEEGLQLPSARVLLRARARLDCVAMLCSRLDFAGKYRRPDGGGRCLYVYCDSSPSKGREIFGSILDVYLHGVRETTLTLPGALLSHGFTGALSKVATFVWQLWLVAGPDVSRFQEVLEDVRCVTCDYGVEANIPNCRDFIASWVREHLNVNPPRPEFEASPYMFSMSVHVPDWNHLTGALLERTTSSLKLWPKMLKYMRAACEFLRVADYRDTFGDWLFRQGFEHLQSTMTSFSASFARWRYETLHRVTVALLVVEVPCSQLARKEIWGEVQEGRRRDDFLEAVGSDMFWKWLRTFSPIFVEIDRFRSWSRGCSCHGEAQGKRVRTACERKGRRLQEAPQRFEDLMTFLVNTSHNADLSSSSGDQEIFAELVNFVRLCMDDLEEKFAWVHSPP